MPAFLMRSPTAKMETRIKAERGWRAMSFAPLSAYINRQLPHSITKTRGLELDLGFRLLAGHPSWTVISPSSASLCWPEKCGANTSICIKVRKLRHENAQRCACHSFWQSTDGILKHWQRQSGEGMHH